VAGKTAGGESESSTFIYNPRVEVTVNADGPVAIAFMQRDVRCMTLPGREDLAFQTASVFITDVTTGGRPQKRFACVGTRQACGGAFLKSGHVYHITAGTFAPGQQGAFCILGSGKGLQMKPVPFLEPTEEHAQFMAPNCDPYPSCAGCHHELQPPGFRYFFYPQVDTLHTLHTLLLSCNSRF